MPGPLKDGPDPREHPDAQDNPCLWFDTEGEQAAELYTRIFPNSAVNEISRYGPDTPQERAR